MTRLARHVASGLVVAAIFAAPVCLAADKPSQKDKAAAAKPSADKQLDDQLLRELGDDPAKSKAGSPPDNAGPRLPDPAPQPAKKAVSPLDEDLLKQLEGSDDKQPADEPAAKGSAGDDSADSDAAEGGPVDRLTRQMRDVQRRLQHQKGDADTQQLEKKIVETLQKLVDEASQQSSSSSSSSQSQSMSGSERDKTSQPEPGQQAGSGNKPQSGPARDSNERVGKPKVEKPDLSKLQDLMKDVWGELPPRLRQQMMQSSVEHFVPKYEFEIEEYFKTLAERQHEKP